MAEAEFRAILLVLLGGAYFFLVLPLVTFRLRRVLPGRSMALFLGAAGVWFAVHILIAAGSPGAGPLLVLSAASMGVAILTLGRNYLRLVSEAGDGRAEKVPPPQRAGLSPP